MGAWEALYALCGNIAGGTGRQGKLTFLAPIGVGMVSGCTIEMVL